MLTRSSSTNHQVEGSRLCERSEVIGPPPHIHTREDEVFYIAQGEFDILLGDRTIRAKVGDVLDAPRNVRHTDRCAGEGIGTIVFLTYPAGIERFLAEAAKIGPSEMDKLFELAAHYGLIFEKPEVDS